MSEKTSAEFHEPRLSWTSNALDATRTAYMGMHGRISVASLLAHMATIAPEIPPEQMMLNWATVTWKRPATAEEYAEREEQHRRADERRESWERETLVRLAAKYGPPAPSTAPLTPSQPPADHGDGSGAGGRSVGEGA